MFKKTQRVILPVIILLLFASCGFRDPGNTENKKFVTQNGSAKENVKSDKSSASQTPADSFAVQGNSSPHIIEYQYLPVEALVTTTPGNNEFSGKTYYIHLYPGLFGDIKDGNSENYVSGYAFHAEDESISGITIGGIPSFENWRDIFDVYSGFLVAFTYIGFSEEYNEAYGLYISHGLTPDHYGQYESIYSDYCTCEDDSHSMIVREVS